MTADNRLANAEAESQLGDDALKAARALVELGLHNDAVSRAYYAAFHYARAVLLLQGLEPKTHRGVIALLTRHRLFPEEVLSALARLQTFRDIADYDARTRISAERANAEIDSAACVVEAGRAAITSAMQAP